MNKYLVLLLVVLIGITTHSYGQKGFPNYYHYIELATKADSLYRSNDFKDAGKTYILAANVQVEKGIEIPIAEMYYGAACSFSKARKTNDAYQCLNILTRQTDFYDVDRITTDTDFDFIKKDKRWENVISQIKIAKANNDRKTLQIQQRTTITQAIDDVIFYPYTSYVKQFLENDTLCFLSVNCLNYRVFFTGNSYASYHLDEIKTELATTLTKSLTILDTTAYKRGINIVIIDSPEELQELTGFYVHGGFACIGQDLVFIVCNEKRRWQFVHEGFHLISNQIWGYTQSRLLNEGSAVFADNQCYYDNPIYAITAYIAKNKTLFSWQALIEDFDQKARENEIIVYIQSASIFKYLYEKYGVEKMKLLWIGGFEKFEEIYHIPIADIEKEWLNHINTIIPPENLDWDNLMKNGCG